MVVKKYIHKDVFRNSPLYLGLGLCMSLVVVITAFEWKFYDQGNLVDLGLINPHFEEIMDIPLTEQPPPPPPLKKTPQVIEEVTEEEILEDVEIDIDIEITENDAFSLELPEVAEPEEEEDIEQIITIAEEMPTPVGGFQAFYKFFKENVQYPPLARKAGIEGRVVLEITISKEGKLVNAIVATSVGFGCDEEALRVMNLWKDWNPGRQRGVPRNIRMYVPMIFRFSD